MLLNQKLSHLFLAKETNWFGNKWKHRCRARTSIKCLIPFCLVWFLFYFHNKIPRSIHLFHLKALICWNVENVNWLNLTKTKSIFLLTILLSVIYFLHKIPYKALVFIKTFYMGTIERNRPTWSQLLWISFRHNVIKKIRFSFRRRTCIS